ncbi:MAG: GerMN domain-containing protein, partial [Planctomycetota bacterium]
MRFALAAIACLFATTTAATAQEVLFFRNQNLASVPPLHSNVADAIAHLCTGPSPTELAAGYTSHVPPGTRLVAAQQQGTAVRLVFDTTFLDTAPGCQREHAIEQIDKTALRAPGIHIVHLAIRLADGSEQPLAALIDGPTPAPLAAKPLIAANLQSS